MYSIDTLKEKKLMRNSCRRKMRKKKLKQKVLALGKGAEKAKRELDQHVKISKREIENANSKIITLQCVTRIFWECCDGR